MRCGIANGVAALALLIPIAGRLVGVVRHNVSDAPISHSLPQGATPDTWRDTLQADRSLNGGVGCPVSCNCHAGEPSNGGQGLVSGMCFSFCSKKIYGLRHCGDSASYREGEYIDCRSCKEPQHFGANYNIFQPQGEVKGSLILLGPWNASLGWGMDWVIKNSEELEPAVKNHFRILDVTGRKMPDGDFTSWYNYDGEDNWHRDVPLQPEVDLAVSYVHHLIEQEYQIVGDYRRIVLAGLSQGASLAIESALRFPQPLGLVVSQRGSLFDSRREDWTHVAETPYILTVGGEDHYYTVDLLISSCQHLQAVNAPVFLKEIPGLDHYKWSKPEWLLSIKAFAIALSQDPKLAELTDWTLQPRRAR